MHWIADLIAFGLMLASLAAAFLGYSQLTQATAGVGFICLGVLIAIYSRLVQAQSHHEQLMKRFEEAEGRLKPY